MAAGDIGNNLRTYLLTKSAITDLLGAAGEIYSDVLPQRGQYTLPAIVFSVISGGSGRVLTGSANYGRSRIQVDCWADERDDANALGEAVRSNVEHYSGAAGDDDIDIAMHDTQRYIYEPPKDASENGLFGHSADYMILHDYPAVAT